MSLALHDIRPLLKARLELSPELAGVTVLLDDQPPGAPAREEEDTLRNDGIVISIPSILGIDLRGGDPFTPIREVSAELAVYLRTNPLVRTRLASPAAPVAIEALVTAVIAAATAMTPQRGRSEGLIQPAVDLARLTLEDSGCITYLIRFTAATFITSTTI
jgi:hypothetical protein